MKTSMNLATNRRHEAYFVCLCLVVGAVIVIWVISNTPPR